MKRVANGTEWTRMGKDKTAVAWKKHTAHHWQTLVRGEVLDYWPSKKKFQFRGKVEVGDVNKFIARVGA